jgi:hypothetical protein
MRFRRFLWRKFGENHNYDDSIPSLYFKNSLYVWFYALRGCSGRGGGGLGESRGLLSQLTLVSFGGQEILLRQRRGSGFSGEVSSVA